MLATYLLKQRGCGTRILWAEFRKLAKLTLPLLMEDNRIPYLSPSYLQYDFSLEFNLPRVFACLQDLQS